MRKDTSSKIGWMVVGGALLGVGYALGASGAGAREANAQQQGSDRSTRQSMAAVDQGGFAVIIDQSNFAYVVDDQGRATRVANTAGRNEDVRVR